MPASRPLLFEPLESRQMLAVAPQLIDAITTPIGSDPQNFTEFGGAVYFQATDFQTGAELWRTDGSEAGTVLVADIVPGAASSRPVALIEVQGSLYFTTNTQTGVDYLWKLPAPGEQPVRLSDDSGRLIRNPSSLIEVDGLLYFTAIDVAGYRQIYRSDGTDSGTAKLTSLTFGTSGTAGGPSGLTAVGSTIFFTGGPSSSGVELWKTNGTAAGTVFVKEIRPGSPGGAIGELFNYNGTLMFTANDGSTGQELWRSDGTAAGTVLVADLLPGGSGSFPRDFQLLGDRLYFSTINFSDSVWTMSSPASVPTELNLITTSTPIGVKGGSFYYHTGGGQAVWKTDGSTLAGVKVADIDPPDSYDPEDFFLLGDTLYFFARGRDGRRRIWAVDEPAGTVTPVADLGVVSYASALQVIGDAVWFQLSDDATGNELWRFDGETATRVRDVNPANVGSNPDKLTAAGNTLYFSGSNGGGSTALWSANGPAGELEQLSNFNLSWPDVVERTFPVGTSAFFTIDSSYAYDELRFTDGTRAGTNFLTFINVGSGVVLDGILYFNGEKSNSGNELWKSDGTVAGTVLVRDIRPGVNTSNQGLSSNPSNFVVAGGKIFFTADDGVNGVEVWTTDGTEAGTVRLSTVNHGITGAPDRLAGSGDRLYFRAADVATGSELWTSDGTVEGTRIVKDIRLGADSSLNSPSGVSTSFTDVNGTLFFTAIDNSFGNLKLWKTDGTEVGTVIVKDFGSTAARPEELTNVGGTLFLSVYDAVAGRELWKSDGTTAGTVRVADMSPGSTSSSLNEFTEIAGRLYFVRDDPTNGYQLWRSDGTEAGTKLISDMEPSYATKSGWGQQRLTNVGGVLYYLANDGQHGREPWFIDTRGDFDWDDDVDGADLLAWQRALGATPTAGTAGDANSSGLVDADDLAIWRQRFEPADVALHDAAFAALAVAPQSLSLVPSAWPAAAPSSPSIFLQPSTSAPLSLLKIRPGSRAREAYVDQFIFRPAETRHVQPVSSVSHTLSSRAEHDASSSSGDDSDASLQSLERPHRKLA